MVNAVHHTTPAELFIVDLGRVEWIRMVGNVVSTY